MILPLNDEERLEDYDVDIIFIPGQTSHPLRSWRMHNPGSIFADRFLYKTWIKEYLIPDIEDRFGAENHQHQKGLKPRVICIGFETKTNLPLLNYFNIKDREP